MRDVRFAQGDKQFLTVLDNIMGNVPTIFVWDLEINNLENHPDCPKQTILGHASKIGRAVWGPLNKRIFSASDDATLRVWDPETGAPCAMPRWTVVAFSGISQNLAASRGVS